MDISLDLKFIHAWKREIIMRINANYLFPGNQSLEEAINSIVKTYRIPILRKVRERSGRNILIALRIFGISHDEFPIKKIDKEIEQIKGIDSIMVESNPSEKNFVILKVAADFDGIILYNRLRNKKSEMGIDFKQKLVKPGLVEIQVLK